MDTTTQQQRTVTHEICSVCTESATSQVHRNLDPKAVRGMWDTPHHVYQPTTRTYTVAAR